MRGYRESDRNFKFAALEVSRHVALPFGIVQHLVSRGDVGGVKLRGGGECLHGSVIAHDEMEHLGQELRISGGTAQGIRTNPAFGQERAQPVGIRGDERERLNRNDFSYFPRVPRRFYQRLICLSLTYCLYFSSRSCPSLRKLFKQVETTSREVLTRAAPGLNGLERIWR